MPSKSLMPMLSAASTFTTVAVSIYKYDFFPFPSK
jgi:hypothetical protein